MIIETRCNIDSRFILYDTAMIFSKLGTVRVLTSNDRFCNFNGNSNIEVQYCTQDDVVDTEQFNEDYIFLDNVIGTKINKQLFFVDPYTDQDFTLIPKSAWKIRIMKGAGKRIKINKNDKFIDESTLAKATILDIKEVVELSNYEDVYIFEKFQKTLKLNKSLIKAFSAIKELFPNGLSIKGDANEHRNSNSIEILW